MDLEERNLKKLQQAQANYLEAEADKLSTSADDTQAFYLGYGTFEAARHCVKFLDGTILCGDQQSLQTNGSVPVGTKVMVHLALGGQPIFYAMPGA